MGEPEPQAPGAGRSERRAIVYLTLPVWGTLVAVGLIVAQNVFLGGVLSDTVRSNVTQLIVSAGVLLVAYSAAPIVTSSQLGLGAKIMLTLLYYLGAAIVVFVLGLFLLCMYRCN
jgi:NADH:ubiquinone oxidoreductase subunit K